MGDKESVKRLQEQISDMKQLKANNEKGHTERMDATAKDNLEKTDARQAQYEAEIVEMRRLGAKGHAEHSAWMDRLRAQNEKKMAKMESDGLRKLNVMKMHGRGDELRRRNACAEVNASHDADMTQIEEKHQSDLTEARRNRAENLSRHKSRMAAMTAQQKTETDAMELRQRNEVSAQGRLNDAKAATEAENMKALKGKGQTAMDEMCRLMHETEELEEAVEASTERFFVLADKVKDQSTLMRSHDDLRRLTEALLTKQMINISTVGKEIANTRTKLEDATTLRTVKELRRHLKAVPAEQESLRKRISRQMDAFDKVNEKLLEKHERVS